MGFEDDPRDESYWDDHPDNPVNNPPTKSTEELQAEHIVALEAENAKQRELLKRWHHEADSGNLDGVDLELVMDTYIEAYKPKAMEGD